MENINSEPKSVRDIYNLGKKVGYLRGKIDMLEKLCPILCKYGIDITSDIKALKIELCK